MLLISCLDVSAFFLHNAFRCLGDPNIFASRTAPIFSRAADLILSRPLWKLLLNRSRPPFTLFTQLVHLPLIKELTASQFLASNATATPKRDHTNHDPCDRVCQQRRREDSTRCQSGQAMPWPPLMILPCTNDMTPEPNFIASPAYMPYISNVSNTEPNARPTDIRRTMEDPTTPKAEVKPPATVRKMPNTEAMS